MEIKIKYCRDIEPLKTFKSGDWIDLRCAEDISMAKGEFRYIPLGVAIQLPKGYEALVVPRSSTFKHYGIIQTNSIGVIDESYCGDDDEWHFPAYSLKGTHIAKNERIAQFRIIKHADMELITVDSLGNENRGGLGSTGRN